MSSIDYGPEPEQVEFGMSPPSSALGFFDDVNNAENNVDKFNSPLVYAYAFTIVVFVVPFILHIAVGWFGCVHEYVRCLKSDRYGGIATRSRRREFIGFHLTHLCILYDLVMLDTLLDFGLFDSKLDTDYQQFATPGYLTVAYYVLSLAPCIAVKIRRLHDTGRSGWWLLFELVPGMSIVPAIVMWFFDSELGTNLYGANPKGQVHPEELLRYMRNAEADILEEGLVTFRGVDVDNDKQHREHLLPHDVAVMGYRKVIDGYDDVSLGGSSSPV
jgi:uncharacterized membrane protein YhaH (DUF805 family)